MSREPRPLGYATNQARTGIQRARRAVVIGMLLCDAIAISCIALWPSTINPMPSDDMLRVIPYLATFAGIALAYWKIRLFSSKEYLCPTVHRVLFWLHLAAVHLILSELIILDAFCGRWPFATTRTTTSGVGFA